jgi:hypothetical protein
MSPIHKISLIVLAGLAAGLLAGCAHHYDPSKYRDVSIDDLIRYARQYDGNRVRVRGFLVPTQGMELLDPRWKECYGVEPERSYVTTTIPYSSLGPRQANKYRLPNEGRLVVVVGVFRNSRNPLGRLSNTRPSDPRVEITTLEFPDYRIAGPIRNARIESFGTEKCTSWPDDR